MNLSEVHELADALLFAWYPGEEGGTAAADIMFGRVSPSGRLPITFPKSLEQLPAYEDYSMSGRTYRYMTKEPMYPFGFGLSYAKFDYSDLALSKERISKKESTTLTCKVTNTSDESADEIIQLYITANSKELDSPLFSLKGVQRISLNPGSSQEISFVVSPQMLNQINEKGEKELKKGDYTISIGGSLPTKRSLDLGASQTLSKTITVK
jgi:beta-glucosidase